MLQETTLGDLERVWRSPNRKLQLGEQVRERAQMIFVAVRQEDAVQALALCQEPAEVRMPNVDADVVVGESGAAIDDHDAPCLLQREAVHADLAEASERNDANALGRLSR